jgi:membrane associated rhomboid family serine protease
MTLALIVLNIAAFLLEMSDPNRFISVFALWPLAPAVADQPPFHLWQMVTYSALHANVTHLAFNMFGFYVFGRDVERTIGRVRVATLYLASVVSGALVQAAVALLSLHNYPTIGASAGVFGLLVSYAMLFPTRRVVLLFPPIPMPAWVFATGYGLLELFLGVSGKEVDVAHFAHIGGMLGAIALILYWSRTHHHSWID